MDSDYEDLTTTLMVGPPAKWPATSNVEVGQSTLAYPANRRRVDRERRDGQSHREDETEGGSGKGRGQKVAKEGGLYFDIRAPDFIVISPLMGPVCLRSQSRASLKSQSALNMMYTHPMVYMSLASLPSILTPASRPVHSGHSVQFPIGPAVVLH